MPTICVPLVFPNELFQLLVCRMNFFQLGEVVSLVSRINSSSTHSAKMKRGGCSAPRMARACGLMGQDSRVLRAHRATSARPQSLERRDQCAERRVYTQGREFLCVYLFY